MNSVGVVARAPASISEDWYIGQRFGFLFSLSCIENNASGRIDSRTDRINSCQWKAMFHCQSAQSKKFATENDAHANIGRDFSCVRNKEKEKWKGRNVPQRLENITLMCVITVKGCFPSRKVEVAAANYYRNFSRNAEFSVRELFSVLRSWP